MSLITGRFRKAHGCIFLGFTLTFRALTFWLLVYQSPSVWSHTMNFTVLLAVCLAGCPPTARLIHIEH
jgi:uncharacterized membrane protein